MSPEEIKIVLGRLGSLGARVDSGFVTQGEQIKNWNIRR